MSITQIMVHFALGFITSFLGSLPLGSINAAVIRISLVQTINAALRFIAGATLAELVYSFLAVHFSGILSKIPQLNVYIELFCIPVFSIIGFSYWYAKPKKLPDSAPVVTTNNFWQGLSLGFLNPLQVPFWLAYSTYFLNMGWIRQDFKLLTVFVIGAICGSSLLLYLIAKFSTLYSRKITLSDATINKFTAGVFFLLAVYMTIKVII